MRSGSSCKFFVCNVLRLYISNIPSQTMASPKVCQHLVHFPLKTQPSHGSNTLDNHHPHIQRDQPHTHHSRRMNTTQSCKQIPSNNRERGTSRRHRLILCKHGPPRTRHPCMKNSIMVSNHIYLDHRAKLTPLCRKLCLEGLVCSFVGFTQCHY